jgi:hypothetical protein
VQKPDSRHPLLRPGPERRQRRRGDRTPQKFAPPN